MLSSDKRIGVIILGCNIVDLAYLDEQVQYSDLGEGVSAAAALKATSHSPCNP